MIVGLDGPVVVLPAQAAAMLARPLERLVADARRRGEQVDPAVLDALIDCERVRRLLVAQGGAGSARGSANGTTEPDSTSDGVEEPRDHLTAVDTAALLGCSASYVRRLARGRHLGTKVAGTWLFSPAEVAFLARQPEAIAP